MHTVMNTTEWLRRQVEKLAEEIRNSPVFDAEEPATPAELRELRRRIALHTYLRQQLLRRAKIRAGLDTREVLLAAGE